MEPRDSALLLSSESWFQVQCVRGVDLLKPHPMSGFLLWDLWLFLFVFILSLYNIVLVSAVQ